MSESQPIIEDNQRLIDLVRYMRHDLHKAGLISNGEYAELVNVGPKAARRLEGYDALRDRERALVQAMRKIKDKVRFHSSTEAREVCILVDAALAAHRDKP